MDACRCRVPCRPTGRHTSKRSYPEPSDAERLAFIAESKSGTIRLDGDGYNPDDFRAFAPVYVHWNAPQSTLRDAIDAAIRATKGGKL